MLLTTRPQFDSAASRKDEQQPRLFDEHNDDDDDAHGWNGFGGKDDGLRVVLVAPDRSPAAPAVASCCGDARTEKGGVNLAKAAGGAVERTAGVSPTPAPVLVGGWGGKGVARYWNARGDLEEAKREEKAEGGRPAGTLENQHNGTEVGGVVR